MSEPLVVTDATLTTALGAGLVENLDRLRQQRTGLRFNNTPELPLETWVGRIDSVDSVELPPLMHGYECRNNKLLELGLQQDDFVGGVERLATTYGPERIGLFVGTSTSGVQMAEWAFAERRDGRLPDSFNFDRTQGINSAVGYLQKRLGLSGPAQAISTACSSSAKIFGSAERFIRTGLCDAAVVLGVDSLCQMTLFGFNSLQAISAEICRPGDRDRRGINIGEAVGMALLEPASAAVPAKASLLGYGESCDGWHMSTPHPEGLGACRAMQAALEMADLRPGDIDYVNLHGTGTLSNDLSEDQAMMQLFNGAVDCSSTKGYTGHTLGAAGIVEALFCIGLLGGDFLPPSLGTTKMDPAIHSAIVLPGRKRQKTGKLERVMSNSFGFGGSNASLVFGTGS